MAKLQNRRKKSAALIVAAGMTVAGTGVAFAYWTSSGTDDGVATTGNSVALNVVAGALDGPDLTPGGPEEQTIPFTVTNPSEGTQYFATMTVKVANPDGTPWTAVTGCSDLDYTVVVSTNPAPAELDGGEDVDGVATISMKNLSSNQDACQGQDVPLYFLAGTLPLVP